tara:strand:+ start:1208 stop:1465 length:258 start_codon:yes stop_codon:yes gene_type:complete
LKGDGLNGCFSGFGVAEIGLQNPFQHSDLKDADPSSWSTKASPKESGKSTEALSKTFIHSVEVAIEGRDQSRSISMRAVGIEVNL